MVAFARVIGNNIGELVEYYGYSLMFVESEDSEDTMYSIFVKDGDEIELVDKYYVFEDDSTKLDMPLIRHDLMQFLHSKDSSKQVRLYQDKSSDIMFVEIIAYDIEELTQYFGCELSINKNTLVTEEVHDVYLNFDNDIIYVATVYGELDSIMRDSKLAYDIMKVIERRKNVKLVQI